MSAAALRRRCAAGLKAVEALSGTRAGLLLPPLLAAVCCALALAGPDKFSGSLVNYAREAKGGFLLAGVPEPGMLRSMPLFGMLFSAALNAGLSVQAFSVLLLFADHLLVFCAGGLLGGYAAGLLALAAGALLDLSGVFGFDTEQALYAATLLLVVCAETLRLRRPEPRWQALAGFSVGLSLLVRSPLALLPLISLAAEAAAGGLRRPGFARGALVYLAAAGALLLPWWLVGFSAAGGPALLDSGRAACNLVSSALGSIFTMEGDYNRLGGLCAGEGALGFFFSELALHPARYAVSVLLRAWQIFLLHPVPLLLFAAGFAYCRENERLRLYLPPLYFLAVLAAFSVEPRYLCPLVFLLPPYFAAAAAGPGAVPSEVKSYLAALYAAAGAAAGLLLLLAALYPARSAAFSAAPETWGALARRWPRDRVFLARACRERWLAADDAGYRACLADYDGRFGDSVAGYFLALEASPARAALPAPACGENLEPCMERALLLSLRLFETGRGREGAAEFRRAFGLYESGLNMLRGEPYARDRAVAAELRRDPALFWDGFFYNVLLYRPPGAILKALTGMEKEVPLQGAVLAARRALGAACGATDAQFRLWLAGGTSGAPPCGGAVSGRR